MFNSQIFITIYLLLMISLGYVATDIYLPSLPALATYFHVGDNEVQMTLFTYLLSFALTPLIFGPLSDYWGRKPILLGGVFLGILATLGCLFAPNIYWFIGFRLIQGLGTSAVLICARTSVADLFTGKALAKQMSRVSMLMPLVLSLAPTVGGWLQESFQWQSIFIFLIVYMSCLLFAVAFSNETLKNPKTEPVSHVFKSYKAHLKNRLFMTFAINFILPSLGLFSYLAISPFLFQQIIGLSPAEYGILSLYVGAVIITTGFVNLKLVPYFSMERLLGIGASLILLGGCSLLFFHMMGILTTWSVLLPSLLYYTCIPLCIANGASKCMSLVKSDYGAATALLSTLQFLLGALMSFICSLIPGETALVLAVVYTFVGVASLINLGYACRLETRQKLIAH